MGCTNRLFLAGLLFISLLPANWMPAQLTQPFFHHYTTADGLPSSETYCVTQDKDGYLWFGTDNGVARFDGYEFKVYGIEDGLTDVVVFNVVEDPHGRLWFGTYSGRVFYFEGGRFYPYKHNDVLIELKHSISFMNLIDVLEDGTFIIRSMRHKLLQINTEGEITYLDFFQTPDVGVYLNPTAGGPEGIQSMATRFSLFRGIHAYDDLKIKTYTNKQVKTVDRISRNNLTFKSNRDKQPFSPDYFAYRPTDQHSGEVLSIIDDWIYYKSFDGIRISTKHIYSLTNYVIPHPETGFWVAEGRGGGLLHVYLKKGLEGKEIQIDRSLSSVSINYVGYDREMGLWVCSQDRGVFYAPNPAINTYTLQSGKNASVPVSLELMGEGHYLASYDDRSFVENRIATADIELFNVVTSQKARPVSELSYDARSGKMYSTQGLFDKKNRSFDNFKKLYDNNVDNVVNYLKHQPFSLPHRLYLGSANVGGYLDLMSGELNALIADSLLENSIQSIGQDHKGHFLLGTMEGLQIQDSTGRFVANNLGIPALDARIISINNLINGGTLIATRGAGLVYLSSEGQNVITKEDGLVSDIIRGIHQSENGDIWINTLSGLSKLRLASDGEIIEIRSFTTHHGLASNEIHDIASYENDIWLASGGGIIDFQEVPLRTYSKPPQIREVIIDGQPSTPDSLQLSAGEHDLKINFVTVNYKMLGSIPYRYRLNSEDKWEYTTNRTVEYPNLPARTYDFEVQSQNQDRIWSESTVLPIIIPTQWYNRWYSYLAGFIITIGIIAGIFKIREQQQIQDRKIQDQIDDLERAAVQAQMNPHFVFNSLNSIQYFILQSDTKQAVYYLSRFASLIRQTLKASVRGVHSLKEEVEMLKIYLSLEKLRFKESFDYQIEVDPALPISQIKVSPMLVQPFVENAILHGLAEVDSGGLVTVNFAGNNQEIVVTITDNGCGFDPAAAITSDSMGSRITQRRLQKLGVNDADSVRERIHINSSTGKGGRPQGTIVTLFIPSINQ